MFVKVMKKGRYTAKPRFGRSRGFAAFGETPIKDGMGHDTVELALSREQADFLWRWLGRELHGLVIEVEESK